MNILVFGAPGTGKGTQSDLLVSHFQLHHISTGNILREAIQKKTSLGLQAQGYMEQGQLVPDLLMTSLIKEVISPLSFSQGFILDGFPRTLIQAQSLDSLLKKLSRELNQVLYLNVDESVLIERIVGRRLAEKSGCVYHVKWNPPKQAGFCDKSGEKLIHRQDDTEDVVQVRLKVYLEQTLPVIDYYRKKRLLKEVEGIGTPTEVFLRIKESLADVQ